jgi:RNA polymerase sigma-70 factor (ECF subfamily)
MELFRRPIIFDDLYHNYSHAIRKRIASYIKDETAAEDVLQETFLKVWKKMPTYDPNRGSLFSWLNSIAISTCIDFGRRVQNKVPDELASSKMSNLEDERSHPDNHLILCELTRLTCRLSPELYKVVVTVFFRGHTQEEAASILRLPLGTIKSRQRRALQIMRQNYREF